MIIKCTFFSKSKLSFAVALLSGSTQVFAFGMEFPNELPPSSQWLEAGSGQLEPDWFDNKDHTVEGIAFTLRNFNRYYKAAETRYGTSIDASVRAKTLANVTSFVLDNTIGLKINPAPPRYDSWTIQTPLIPLINRKVNPFNITSNSDPSTALKSMSFNKPVLPPMRWTRDGRVGILGSATGVDNRPQPLTFHLNRPEILQNNLLDNAAGITTLDPAKKQYAFKDWGVTTGLYPNNSAHTVAICDPVEKKNPYACDASGNKSSGGTNDCYDVTLVGSGVKYTYITSGRTLLTDENDPENADKPRALAMVLPMLEPEERMFSRPMKIMVSSPKTSHAKIESVTFGADFKQAQIQQGVLFELNLPADGRLAVMRRSGIPLVWKDSNTGATRVGAYDTVYAVAPAGKPACDASSFSDLRPISHAPFDPAVKDKYPFAKYQFRDPMGNKVPNGEDIKGTYPWLDMDAKNMSLTIGDAELYNGDKTKTDTTQHRYNSTCLVDSICNPNVAADKAAAKYSDQGLLSQFALMGSWTKGKMIVVDNMINYSDFRTAIGNGVSLSLYQAGSAPVVTNNKSSQVSISGARDLAFGTKRDSFVNIVDPNTGTDVGKYLVKNTTFFDSIENRMNFNPHMKAAMPNDVVWTLSSGATSDEFSFDDALNNNAFIISDMAVAYSRTANTIAGVDASPYRMAAYDGWSPILAQWQGQVKVQNAATTLPEVWRVPDAGDVLNGRIEPVANGGIKGKGFYFNGINTQILYDIPLLQPRAMNQSPWFHSVFLDAREVNKDSERVIINFPDKSRLTMTQANDGRYNIYGYNQYGERQVGTSVPTSFVKERWLNLGLQIQPNNNSVLFVNGYPYGDLALLSGAPSGGSLFQMKGGDLVLGRAHHSYDQKPIVNKICGPLGLICWNETEYKNVAFPTQYSVFKGWMDEYKVFSYVPDFESICNFSHGTLVSTGTNAAMNTQASLYQQNQHNRVTAALQLRGQSTYSQYACYLGDRLNDKTAVLHRLPTGSVAIRASMHFPEGPLYHNKPRPDSTKNEFCLACHTDASHNLISGLSKTSALGFRAGTMASTDPRRQPTQPPAQIHGNLPVDFFRSIGSNASATSGSINIDDYILKSKP